MNNIVVRGLVTIKQGNKVLTYRIPNHFVDAGLKGLISSILTYKPGYLASSGHWYMWANEWHIYLGNDTGAATTTGMTALTTPIGSAPGTAPNSKSISSKDGAGDGIWEAIFHATWNAGTVSGTLGELALYMKAPTISTFGWINTHNPSKVMISRLSSADTDFSSFSIDAGAPLTVDWTVQFAFA